MQPMGNEKPGPPNVPGRPVSPFAAAPQTALPFLSSGPVASPEPFGYRATPPVRFNGPSMSSQPPSNPSTNLGTYQRFPTQNYPASSQPVPPSSYGPSSAAPPVPPSLYGPPPAAQPVPPSLYGPPPAAQPVPPSSYGPPPAAQPVPPSLYGLPPAAQPVLPPPPVIPSISQQGLPPPVSFRPQPHTPTVPMGPPPHALNLAPSRGNIPPSPLESSFSAPKPILQPSLHGYSNMQATPVTHIPPTQAPFLAHQGGYVPPPPMASQIGLNSREKMNYPNMGPPVSALQGLVEEFSSLSVGSVPGSVDPGVDVKALPRPLNGDEEPNVFVEMYPLNCHPRYLRLTTSAIPNSQSLLSRWHLPLGAVVHPLAEAPDGDEVPIVNFGPAGIIRCRRCRTYVNPYVTFTDGGRKWRCNICALLNDVPGDYFSLLDASGRRCDADQRPELLKGSIEFVAPTEYMVRPPMPPLYFFLIDVSLSAVRSGMLEMGWG
eukprot:TRINITY_DN1577_c0_g1_i7.p1 TRINITY_DN1577_c0_g1~~TRINITY_DN1577_c0_g1_i7.p1  ORF type:complete len:488 (+),score=89.41 TRINITY_DN1577_c0_g1_i7:268-1731(+)